LALVLGTACGGGGPAGPSGGGAGASGASVDTARLFDQGTLHDVRLELSPGDWDALRASYESNAYYRVRITIDGQSPGIDVGIRSRGKGTRNSRKPGLRVDFNRYSEQGTFGGYNSLVLENMYGDLSFLHERLAFLVFREVGLPAPRDAYARVTVNGQYWGLYGLVESVDRRFLGERLGENGGTLFEYKTEFGYDLSYRGPEAAAYVPFPFEPENAATADASGLVEFTRTISEAPDAELVAQVSAFVDPRQVLRFYAVEVAVAEADGLTGGLGVNNFYLYQFRGQSRFTFIPWDRDFAFSRPDHPAYFALERNRLVRRLLEDGALHAFYDAELLRILRDYVNPAYLLPRLEQAYAQIRPSVLEDVNKPPSADPNGAFELAVERVRTVILERERQVQADLGVASSEGP
jgi:spore coat protein CotH